MRIFAANDKVVQFEPVGPEDQPGGTAVQSHVHQG
ncbi:MAG: hypothetical protein ACPGVU_23295 [Limisphaerales bacterium]